MRKIIVVEEDRCLACKTCVLECAMAHSDAGSLAEALRADVPPQPRVHVEPFGSYGLPLQCRHCEDAPCVTICPTKAVQRPSEGGPVLLDQRYCIGCKFCLLVCPFGVIDLSRDGKATVKCDLCIERTEAGQEPACVAGCPTGALRYCDVDDYVSERRRGAAERIAAGAEKARQVVVESKDGR
jgi:carbon-monoxide dehydrogenase iron sulfur subunit